MYKDPSVFSKIKDTDKKEAKYIVSSDSGVDNSAPITSTIKTWSISKISENFIDNKELVDSLGGKASKDDLVNLREEVGNNSKGLVKKVNDLARDKQSKIDNNLATSSKEIVSAINEVKNLVTSQPDIDLSNYYTKSETYNKAEVNQKIDDAITGGEVDLSNYYTKIQTDNLLTSKTDKSIFDTLNTKVTGIDTNKQNKTDSDLATTSKEIVGAINEVKNIASNIPVPDLSNYYTKSQTDNLLTTKTDISTFNSLNNKVTEIDTNKQNKTDNNLATTSKEIVGAINEVKNIASNIPSTDLSNYYNKSQTNNLLDSKTDKSIFDNLNNKVTEIDTNKQNKIDSNLTTTSKEIVGAINEVKNIASNPSVDLSNYYNKSETYNKAEVNKKIDDAITGGEVDLSNYYTKAQSDSLLNLKTDKSTFDTLNTKVTGIENDKQNKTDNTLTTTNKTIVGAINEVKNIASNPTVDLSNYYNKSQTDSLLTSKTDTSTFNTLNTKVTGIDNNKQNKTDSNLTTTSKEIVGAINEVKNMASNPSVDLSNYYNKSETDAEINKLDLSLVGSTLKLKSKEGILIGTGIVLPSDGGGGGGGATIDDSASENTTDKVWSISKNISVFAKISQLNYKVDYEVFNDLKSEVNAVGGVILNPNYGLKPRVDTLEENKQDKTDNTLTTTNKTIVGAINEIKSSSGGGESIVPNIQIGTVSTLNPGTNATVTRRGTNDSPIFDFGIPRGNVGSAGATGPAGAPGVAGSNGTNGKNGTTWKPSVNASGIMSWTSSTTQPDNVDLKAMIKAEINKIITIVE